MCLAPVLLPNGMTVGCRKCWQCKANQIDDIVGRAIAESKSAVASHAVTLTYGRDEHDNTRHTKTDGLRLRDVQAYLKKWRAKGFPLRYIAAGEFGDQHGRAHWHLILFWQEKVPPIYLDERYEEETWPHGYSYFQKMHYNSARYALKYVFKEQSKGEDGVHSFSSQPPLGTEYFKHRAELQAYQGVAPTSAYYTLPGIYKNQKETILRKFMLSNVSLDRYMEHFFNAWRKCRPTEPIPPSEFLENWLDKEERKEEKLFRIERRTWRNPPRMKPPRGFHVRYHVTLDKFFAVCGLTRVWFLKHTGGVYGWIEDDDLDANADQIERDKVLILPAKLRRSSKGPRMGESYSLWRVRQIKEERQQLARVQSLNRGASSKR